MIPSKELLSEVLGIDVAKILDNTHERTISVYERDFKYPCTYNASAYITTNIYELAHKCKEWAFSKGYIIEVGVHPTIKRDKTDRDYFYKITTDRGQILVSKFVEIIKTEPEAIFKACEWIMEDRKRCTQYYSAQ